MGAGALDDLAVRLDQRIGFARERRDLLGETSLQPFGAAGADRREALGNALQRREAEAHLEHRGEQEHDRQHAEGDRDRAIEGLRLVLDLERIARDRDPVAPLLAEIDGALDQAQALVLGARHVALARAVRGGRHVQLLEVGQAGVPQRARGAHLRLRRGEPRHLPVPAGQRQFEQRFAERLGELLAFLGRRDVGDQRPEIDAEPAVERTLGALAVERREHDPGDQQDDDGHGGRGNEQAQRKRIGAHVAHHATGGVSR